MKKRNMKWKTLKSEYLIRRPWLTARRDAVELPSGVINQEYYVLEYPDWVNVIAITDEGKYVFIRQYRHGIGRTCNEIVAGVMEEGETPLEAAKRELYEETGYGEGEWHNIMNISANPSSHTNISHSFIATGVKKISGQHLDATEDIEICLLNEDEILRMLRNDEMLQSLMAAPLWKYFAEKAMNSRNKI